MLLVYFIKSNSNMDQPSLCIPHVFSNITENRIRRVFDELKLGKIKRIDILQRRNSRGQNYNRVFIHFHKWYNGEEAVQARTRLISGKDIKIVYDNPWFWKVSVNKAEKKNPKPKAHICFDTSESEDQHSEKEEEDINPRQLIRSVEDNYNKEDSYTPDYGYISPPKCRSLIRKNRHTKLDVEQELYGDLDN